MEYPSLSLVIFLLTSPVLIAGMVKKLPKIRCDASGDCFCPEDPLTERYSDPADPTCSTYYLCHLNRAFKKACDVRTAFHPEVGECMPRQRVPEKYCKFPVKCPVFRNMYVEDPQDCSKYYLCFYRKPLHYSCDANNYFDPEKQKCILDDAQSEACQKQAQIDTAARLRIEDVDKIETTALDKAKQNVKQLTKSKGKPEQKPPAPSGIRKLDNFGKAVRGGSQNLNLFSKKG